jgi:hypothetical protein
MRPQHAARVALGDSVLPGLKRDPARVLHAFSVLGEEVWPVGRVGDEVQHAMAGMPAATRSTGRHDEAHRRLALGGEDRIRRVKRDVKPVDPPRMLEQASVSQVEAKEIGVLEDDQAGKWAF